MTQLILGVHSGSHDAAAAIFEGYALRAAVHLERLTRRKSDGSRHPDLAIDEVLSIAGATRRDVDVVTYSRSMFPTRYFRRLHGAEWLREQYRTHIRRRLRRQRQRHENQRRQSRSRQQLRPLPLRPHRRRRLHPRGRKRRDSSIRRGQSSAAKARTRRPSRSVSPARTPATRPGSR